MAISPVNLCADLQAWHSAGLSFLYFPDVETKALLNAPRAASGPQMEEQAKSQLLQKNAAKGKPAPSADVPVHAAPQNVATSVADAPDLSITNAKLPAHWEAILEKVKPAAIVWTYKELGEDLLVKGNPDRSRALKELIGGLGLKGGTSTFLPIVLPGADQSGGEGWCFGALLSRLNGRILVAFGPEALALGPYAALGLEPFHEKIVQGRMVLCLPSFNDILASRERFEATKVFLRSAFAKINIQ